VWQYFISATKMEKSADRTETAASNRALAEDFLGLEPNAVDEMSPKETTSSPKALHKMKFRFNKYNSL